MVKELVLIQGRICSGKDHYVARMPDDPSMLKINVSDIVREIVQSNDRSKLQNSKHFDQQIADKILEKLKESDSWVAIVYGTRQLSIFYKLLDFSRINLLHSRVVWLEVPQNIRKKRYNDRGRDSVDFFEAEKKDDALGLSELEKYLKYSYPHTKIVNHYTRLETI